MWAPGDSFGVAKELRNRGTASPFDAKPGRGSRGNRVVCKGGHFVFAKTFAQGNYYLQNVRGRNSTRFSTRWQISVRALRGNQGRAVNVVRQMMGATTGGKVHDVIASRKGS